uniref:Hemimethylated DNA-binding domain-containing protein n=1 Tax=Periophthalmus magnuspinnatus TaxID=409849 RepID=A0A3B4A5A8_9GOBI
MAVSLLCCDWLKEYKTRHRVGIQIRGTVESISKRFFTEVPCVGQVLGDSFAEIKSLGMPEHFCEDELLFILNTDKRKSLTLKYYARKILYFLRQQNILRSLKTFLEQPEEQQSALEGAVLVDQYCNPLADVTLEGISVQLDEMVEKVKKTLRLKNPSHPSLRCAQGFFSSKAMSIPISLSVLYMTLSHKLGLHLEPVNFPNHFLLRWCQRPRGEGNEKSYQLLRDSLDLYLTINPDNVQYLLLQARLYFHLGIWPEKVLDILQHIQALDPSQHGAVGYLVQHTLEHIQHKKHPVTPDEKRRSAPEHVEVQYSVGLIMKHKRSGYNCVIYGWDPKCTMSQEWITTMRVQQLSKGANQPFYNVLVQDGTCRYAAQENLEPHSAPLEIGHPEVGRYFSEFVETHYVANEELEMRYPEDTRETLGKVHELYHGLSLDSGHQDQASNQPNHTTNM